MVTSPEEVTWLVYGFITEKFVAASCKIRMFEPHVTRKRKEIFTQFCFLHVHALNVTITCCLLEWHFILSHRVLHIHNVLAERSIGELCFELRITIKNYIVHSRCLTCKMPSSLFSYATIQTIYRNKSISVRTLIAHSRSIESMAPRLPY